MLPIFGTRTVNAGFESLWYSAKELPSIGLKRLLPFETLLSQETGKLMVFKLITAASRTWRKLQSENPLPKVIQSVQSRDGLEVSLPTSHSTA